MSSRSLMLFIIFLVAKYGSVVGGLSSAIVPEGLKGNGPGMHGVDTISQVNMHCVQWERGFGCVDIETIQTVLPTHAQNLAIVFILVSCLHMGGIRRIARIVEGS